MTQEKDPSNKVSRRQFVGTVATAAAAVTILPRHVLGAGFQAPSDTVNVAIVGYANGMGTSNLFNVAKTDNIVALCDVDAAHLNDARKKFPGAEGYSDFRKLLERKKNENKNRGKRKRR